MSSGWRINQPQHDPCHNLQNQQHQAGASEDIPPACSALRYRMQSRFLDRSFELYASLYPTVESLVPGLGWHGSILATIFGDGDCPAPGQSIFALFCNVGICPALISSFPFSTFNGYVNRPRSGGPDALLPS